MANPAIVETKLGKLLGTASTTRYLREYFSFQGVRYAKPPIGDLRFKSPRPAEPWTGIYEAQHEGNRSLSMNAEGEIIGDEDCLFLNIYTPSLPSNKTTPKAVMVYVHGGGFYLGSGNKDLLSPEYLLEKDVVVVTINIRLGVMGFIAFQDPTLEATGNTGLKDICMALRWVKENIANFNGDPNNVTIWGQSAGGIATHLLLISPLAKGLFQKAIIQSGIGFLEIATPFRHDTSLMPLHYAHHAGLDTEDQHEAYKFLKNLPAKELTEAFFKYLRWSKCGYEGIISPVVEPESVKDAFATQEAELYYLQNKVNAVPLLLGSNSMDGMVYASTEHLDGWTPPTYVNPEAALPTNMKFPKGSNKCNELGEQVTEFYYGQETPSRRNLVKYSKLQTDKKFTYQIQQIARVQRSVSNEPIYIYQFAFESPQNFYKKMFCLKDLPGACHGDELTYLFHSKYYSNIRYNSPEWITLQRMVTFWTNFAKTGDPNPVDPHDLIKVKWPEFENNKNYLLIGKYLQPRFEMPDSKRMEFWDNMYKLYFEHKYYNEFGEKINPELLNDVKTQMKLLMLHKLSEKMREF